MLSSKQYRLLVALAVAALSLVVANAALVTWNRSLQADLAREQQFIQQTVPLETLYREIVKTLAEAAVKGGDQKLLDMLRTQGLDITVQSGAAGASIAPPSTTPPRK